MHAGDKGDMKLPCTAFLDFRGLARSVLVFNFFVFTLLSFALVVEAASPSSSTRSSPSARKSSRAKAERDLKEQVRLSAVMGRVFVRLPAYLEWRQVQNRMTVPLGTLLQVGDKSAIDVSFPPELQRE